MLREMNRKGDSDRFIQLRDKKVKLIDLYNAWKLGKEHLLYGNEGKGLLEELEAYRTSGIHSRYTETTTQRWLATFKKKGLLKDSHVVAELPQVVKSVQTYYSTKKKHACPVLNNVYTSPTRGDVGTYGIQPSAVQSRVEATDRRRA